MGNQAEAIVRAGKMGMWLSEQMLKGVGPEIFARKPVINGKLIEANHAAFNFGHLATYPNKWLTLAGLDPQPAVVPSNFDELFAAGKECKDDPSGTIYPKMQVVTEAFFSAHNAALELLPKVGDDVLSRPNPREGRIKEMLPTIGAMLVFYCSSHMMMHLGQVSTWRRCFGLGPVM